LTRSITELAQVRAVLIHGARENLQKKVRYEEQEEYQNLKRNWYARESKHKVKFSQIKSYVNDDILDDIKLILKHLKDAGLKRAIIVDLTNPSTKIPVLRAIVPGLEGFEISHSVIGERAKKSFKRAMKKNKNRRRNY